MAVSVGAMRLILFIAVMQVPTSVAIMQFLRFYCNYVCGTFCYIYVGKSFVAIIQVTVFDAIIQLEVSAAFMQVKVPAANMCMTIFTEIMHVGVSVAIMQVVFSTVYNAHGYFYCDYASDRCYYSYVCDSFK